MNFRLQNTVIMTVLVCSMYTCMSLHHSGFVQFTWYINSLLISGCYGYNITKSHGICSSSGIKEQTMRIHCQYVA